MFSSTNTKNINNITYNLLDEIDILYIWDQYSKIIINNLDCIKNINFNNIKNEIRIKYINKDTRYLDKLFERLIYLNVTDDYNFCVITSIYLGNICSIKNNYNNYYNSKYKPTNEEIDIIIEKIDIDKDYNCLNTYINDDKNYYSNYDTLFVDNIINNKTNELLINLKNDVKYINNTTTKNIKDNIKIYNINTALFRLLNSIAYKIISPNRNDYHSNYKYDTYFFNDYIKLFDKIINLLKYFNITNNITYLEELFKKIQKINNTDATNKYDTKIYTHESINNIINDKLKLLSKYKVINKLNLDTDKIINNHIIKINEDINKFTNMKKKLPYVPFRYRYSRLLINNSNIISNIYINNNFWYNEFIYLLTRGLSIEENDNYLYELLESNDKDKISQLDDIMNNWYNSNKELLSIHAQDILDNFNIISLKDKILMKQCWDLNKYYFFEEKYDNMNCDISQYVAFLDDILNREYISNDTIKYIDTSLWNFFHMVPELIDELVYKEQISIIDCFLDFFKYTINMYPYPDCKNNNVYKFINNKKILEYPLEYIFLGISINNNKNYNFLELNIDNKLKNIKNVNILRLFLWKYHNAINSSRINNNKSNNTDLKYTKNYWPKVNDISNKYKEEYIDIVNNLEKIRKELCNILNSINIGNMTINNYNEYMKDNTDNIITNINKLDNLILKSKVLQTRYKF